MNYEQAIKTAMNNLLAQLKRQEQYELLEKQLRMTKLRNCEQAMQVLESIAHLN
jgi:hypothetical protein